MVSKFILSATNFATSGGWLWLITILRDIVGCEDNTKVRQPHGGNNRGAVFDECDVYRPVLAPCSEFFRAIEGVDNPHAVFGEAGGIIRGFFTEHAVVGTVLFQYAGDPVLGELVTGVAEVTATQ